MPAAGWRFLRPRMELYSAKKPCFFVMIEHAHAITYKNTWWYVVMQTDMLIHASLGRLWTKHIMCSLKNFFRLSPWPILRNTGPTGPWAGGLQLWRADTQTNPAGNHDLKTSRPEASMKFIIVCPYFQLQCQVLLLGTVCKRLIGSQ